MKRIFFQTGFTLIELIMATILMSLVLIGLFSINNVLNNNGQDYGQKYLVKSETQTVLDHILGNASLGVGSVLCNDEPIIGDGVTLNPCSLTAGGTNVADANTFCIHQQPTGAGSDIWFCYSWQNMPANPYQIEWCTEIYTTGVPDPRGAGSCIAPPPGTTLITGPTFLGSTYNIAPSFNATPGSTYSFSTTIKNCLNNTPAPAGTCDAGTPAGTGISGDPVNNPEVKITGTSSPLASSSG